MAKKKASKPMVVCLVLDETGSMETVRDSTISGYNEYIASLQKEKVTENIRFSLVKFNTNKVETVLDAVPVSEVPKLTRETYVPDAFTPLYDAIGQTIKVIEGGLKKSDIVTFVMFTDGEENASQEYNLAHIAALIKERQDGGRWTFVYLGANQDSWLAGQRMGLARGNVMDYNQGAEVQAFSSMGAATMAHAKSGRGSSSTFMSDVVDDVEEKIGSTAKTPVSRQAVWGQK